jgi:hypothetical protein
LVDFARKIARVLSRGVWQAERIHVYQGTWIK